MPIETSNGSRLTKREAADLLGVSVRQVLRLMAQGRLACTRVHGERGSLTLFDKEELEAFKAARDSEVHVPKLGGDLSVTARASQEVSLAKFGIEAMGGAFEQLVRQLQEPMRDAFEQLVAQMAPVMAEQMRSLEHMAETMQQANAQIIEQMRPAKLELPLVELAEKTWLSLRESIRLSGLPSGVVRDALKTGRLGRKHGRRWMIKRSELVKFAIAFRPNGNKMHRRKQVVASRRQAVRK